ncbi:hypothetical protein SARC_07204 [Sphaeroforma arctica JP610]|uniref:sulfate adenylyltransferase n=1 Tax=Sphaeroforma arctica JP610 TaxID=667725 RepID=A0A0L0FWU8_9EUKA|nr:hypothetical protein SARC_07204 [Sphaeroforma arctica JP610]KNC80433.1 hypothetical protein SARC_07204 [Sphaeroforma arctica JP610]|eukprot:XP_014154335.1 hypothetical protein SARC_07204 [Sphaeroforma arctica JP610]
MTVANGSAKRARVENSTPVEITANLKEKINNFKTDVQNHLSSFQPEKIVVVSAWLVSDNVIVDLFSRFADFMPTVVGVDTLHLFPETLDVVTEMEAKYNFKAVIRKPEGCNTKEEFEAKFGNHATLSYDDFDKHSKIDPLVNALNEVGKEVSITGRRCDQGNERVSLDTWEPQKSTFNPLAGWSWSEVCEYVLLYNVPYNALHKTITVSKEKVYAEDRDTYSKFEKVELSLPFFAYSKAYIHAQAPYVYIWKSFGDTHTSVPVQYEDSERSGRFVGRLQTECGIHTRITSKGEPHGGKLVELLVEGGVASIETPLSNCTHIHTMNERQVCDFELLSVGGFSPLEGFMNETEYNSVIADMRLPEGQLFGLPVTLDTDDESVQIGDWVELKDPLFGGHGCIHVTSKWTPNRSIEAEKVYGTVNEEHPSVYHVLMEKKKFNIGGKVYAYKLPQRDWVDCKTPAQIRASKTPGKNLIAFQSRNPLHRAHATMFLRAHEKYDADVLVHPVIGPTKDDDIPATVRKLTYDALAKKLDHVSFEYLPYSMMVGGPREALQHALIRKNYGCTHMIIGRDHAGCKDKSGNDFYGAYDAQDLMMPLQKELGVTMVPFMAMVYAKEEEAYIPVDEAKEKGYTPMSISGTKFRKMLVEGEEIPEWFAYPEVVAILRENATKSS